MYIAKMHTRYPEFHGKGYYNFIVEEDEDTLYNEIEKQSHDFSLQLVKHTRHHSLENLIAAYPTKEKLNNKYFKGE